MNIQLRQYYSIPEGLDLVTKIIKFMMITTFVVNTIITTTTTIIIIMIRLDKLAARGVQLKSHYVQPTCTPSR